MQASVAISVQAGSSGFASKVAEVLFDLRIMRLGMVRIIISQVVMVCFWYVLAAANQISASAVLKACDSPTTPCLSSALWLELSIFELGFATIVSRIYVCCFAQAENVANIRNS